jgi:hypothetical protein
MASKSKKSGLSGWSSVFSARNTGILTQRPFWAICIAVALTVGGRIVWESNETALVKQPRFQLEAENLYVTQQPNWVKTNVAQSAYRTGDLGGKSLLDQGLVEQVNNAFSVQTWVRNVIEVRKSPQGVQVQLEYRRPIAMVEIQYEGAPRFQPVDVDGVLLPGNEFSQKETWNYIKIAVPDPATQGLVHGTAWPDGRIQSGARLAECLQDFASELGIYRIQQVPTSEPGEEPLFELHLVNHDRFICRRVLWGRAPGGEVPGEASAAVKLEALLKFARSREDWLLPGNQFDLTGFDFDVRNGRVQTSSGSEADAAKDLAQN